MFSDTLPAAHPAGLGAQLAAEVRAGGGEGPATPSHEVALHEVTFVVVDLETTGGSPADCEITEIGAVKVRGGDVVGELQTLVRPAASIPPFVAVLTGITDATVAAAPPLAAALPAFLEFARGAVLVAHNAPFDLGFLRAACAAEGYDWPGFASLDTARLARRVLTRDETPDCTLASLSRVFRTTTVPCHRALADARATVDVLHGLLERLGGLGVRTLAELTAFSTLVAPEQRRKRHLADALPPGPGVYLFRDAGDRVLYVGTSGDVRGRVRRYFTSSEPRTRMAEMVAAAERVDAVPCAHTLEAEVLELRLIAEHAPPYNRRSRFPERVVWVKLTVEPLPRLSIVRGVRDDGATYLGPFGSGRAAQAAVSAVHDTVPLRQCGGRLSPARPTPACALAQIGRCNAPCDGSETPPEYARHVEAVRAAVLGDPGPVVAAGRRRMATLRAQGRFEDAAVARDRVAAFVGAAWRRQRLGALTAVAELVAVAPGADGGWELAVVRHGRLVAAGTMPGGVPARSYVEVLRASAAPVVAGPGPVPCASAEESERILRWLDRPGVRLAHLDGVWASAAPGAGRWSGWLASVAAARGTARRPGADRGLRTATRPPRDVPVPAAADTGAAAATVGTGDTTLRERTPT